MKKTTGAVLELVFQGTSQEAFYAGGDYAVIHFRSFID